MLRVVTAFLGVVAVSSLLFSVTVDARDSLSARPRMPAGESRVEKGFSRTLEILLTSAFPVTKATQGPRMVSQARPVRKTAAYRPDPVVKASHQREYQSHSEDLYAGTFSKSIGSVLLSGLPRPDVFPEATRKIGTPRPLVFRSPALLEKEQLDSILMPGNRLESLGKFPMGPESGFSHLEIEVSHSRHHLKLIGNSYFGKREVIYECGVGLGSGEFPTPVGVYFVTHIYDDNPWWIPPPNRAWAAGQSPSKRVYGGTMAPLLKKRTVRSRRNRQTNSEDKIESRVSLQDYGYRFHGTNAPRSIGRNQSHGCVRMLPKDAKKVAVLIKELVGIVDRMEAENGSFVLLKSPVRLNLIR